MGINALAARILSAWLIMQGAAYWVNAATHNVDDSDPGIQYYPSNGWNLGNDCSICLARPNQLALIYQQTWHDVTSRPGNGSFYFEYSFTGTDLYVYGILVDIPGIDDLNVNLILTVDGQNHTYAHTAGSTNSYEYQVPVFSIRDLPFQLHDIRVTLVPLSVFLFDYIAYATPDSASATVSGTGPTPSSGNGGIHNSSLSSGAIAGIAIGAIAGVAAIAALIGFFCYKRGRERQKAEAKEGTAEVVTPFHSSTAVTTQVPSSYTTFPQPEYIPRVSEPVPQPRDHTLPYTPPPRISPPSYTEAWRSDSFSR